MFRTNAPRIPLKPVSPQYASKSTIASTAFHIQCHSMAGTQSEALVFASYAMLVACSVVIVCGLCLSACAWYFTAEHSTSEKGRPLSKFAYRR